MDARLRGHDRKETGGIEKFRRFFICPFPFIVIHSLFPKNPESVCVTKTLS
jgi:hypothetical protein